MITEAQINQKISALMQTVYLQPNWMRAGGDFVRNSKTGEILDVRPVAIAAIESDFAMQAKAAAARGAIAKAASQAAEDAGKSQEYAQAAAMEAASSVAALPASIQVQRVRSVLPTVLLLGGVGVGAYFLFRGRRGAHR